MHKNKIKETEDMVRKAKKGKEKLTFDIMVVCV